MNKKVRKRRIDLKEMISMFLVLILLVQVTAGFYPAAARAQETGIRIDAEITAGSETPPSGDQTETATQSPETDQAAEQSEESETLMTETESSDTEAPETEPTEPQTEKSPEETEPISESETNKEEAYDPQPTTREEVEQLIKEYEQHLESEAESEEADQKEPYRKPRWQFQVEPELMPKGYSCILVAAGKDPLFSKAYYTFEVLKRKPRAPGLPWDGSTTDTNFEGSGTNADPFLIKTADQLAGLAEAVNDGSLDTAGKYFRMEEDINLANHNWTPIGTSDQKLRMDHTAANAPRTGSTYRPFKGIFDGNGKIIANLKVTAPWTSNYAGNDYKGLFGIIDNAAVKNIIIENASVSGAAGTGAMVGYATGETLIDNISLYNVNVSSRNQSGVTPANASFGIGGMLGVYDVESDKTYSLSVSRISVDVLTVAAGTATSQSISGNDTRVIAAGGVIGMIRAVGVSGFEASLEKLAVNGKITSSGSGTSSEPARGLGGVIGMTYSAGSQSGQIVLTDTTANVTLNPNDSYIFGVGGIVGSASDWSGTSNKVVIDQVGASQVTIQGAEDIGRTGGVLGEGRTSGSSSSSVEVHGITDNDSSQISVNINVTPLHTTTSPSSQTTGNSNGGAVGVLDSQYSQKTAFKITNLHTSGTVTVNAESVGGVVGEASFENNIGSPDGGQVEVSDCTSSANVQFTGGRDYKPAGGLVGHFRGIHARDINYLMKDCHATGDVTGYSRVGGALGYADWYNSDSAGGADGSIGSLLTIDGCSATGDVKANFVYAGGFVGCIDYGNNDSAANKNPALCARTIVKNSHATGNVWADRYFSGGFGGWVHGGDWTPTQGTVKKDSVIFENCWASGDASTTRLHGVGGFVGSTAKSITYRNCYATGDATAHGDGYAGGFTGWHQSQYDNCPSYYENCYATGNAQSTNRAGGFAGDVYGGTYFTNCYAVGSASVTGARAGGFVGSTRKLNAGAVDFTNCFASGTVKGGTSFGFLGERVSGTNQFVNCFFDTTTTTRTSGASTAVAGLTGVPTKKMIDPETFESWDILNVWHVSLSNGQRNNSNPWYIDKDATYPYLYYQADGFDTGADGIGDGYLDSQGLIPTDFDNTNYFLGVLYYNDGSGDRVLPNVRYDFDFDTAKSLTFKAMTIGSERAYFPYAYPAGSSDYNQHQFWFKDGVKNNDSDGDEWVNTARSGAKSFGAKQKISFGSYSRTNIVAFGSGPYAVKNNDSKTWEYNTSSTYTYVGDKITYRVNFKNYSPLADWKRIELVDPLAMGVTLVNDYVFLYENRLPDFEEKPGVNNDQAKETMLKNYTDVDPANRPKSQEQLDQEAAQAGTTPETAEPYFIYEEGTGAYAGRYILTVCNLPEVEYAKISQGTYDVSGFYLEFVTQVEEAAKTPAGRFPGSGGITAADIDNIRNYGTVTGEMHMWNPELLFQNPPVKEPLLDEFGDPIIIPVELELDDKDKDPIYKERVVQYNSNYSNAIIGMTDKVIDKDYLLNDNSRTHTVIPNDDPNDPNTVPHERKDYANFEAPTELHRFAGWFYFKDAADQEAWNNRDKTAAPEATDPPDPDKIVFIDVDSIISPGHIIDPSAQANLANRDIHLYAKWIMVIPFEFTKHNKAGDPLENVEFELYYWEGSGEPQDADSYVVPGTNVTAGKWSKVITDEPIKSDAQGLTEFVMEKTGYYQLVETVTNSGYFIPDVQWRFETDLNVVPAVLTGPETIKKSEHVFTVDFTSTGSGENKVWSLLNYEPNSVKIIKQGDKLEGGNKVLLDGAEFVLDRYIGSGDPETDNAAASWELIETGVTGSGSNATGEYQFGKASGSNTLVPGRYRITETKSPTGYVKLKKPVYVVLPLEYKDSELPSGIQAADYTYTKGTETIHVYLNQTHTITDVAEFVMPESGMLEDPMIWGLIVGGMLLVLMAAVLFYRHRRKYRNQTT